ncbi:MAG TPA: hypothetical protein GX708_02540 [Gallicola sp.]|nr:hypothetical protein [Gallicola sp.]
MKIIDLLNLMVIGEDLPKKIRYEDEEYYLTSDEETYIGCISHSAIGRRHCLEQCLTDEIEIIEEDKPIEKIRCGENNSLMPEQLRADLYCLVDKINELIEEVNKLKKESDM